jgi:hypothetical protein
MVRDSDVLKASSARRESKYVEFKERFNPEEAQDCCEIIKDIVAIANSGGGCILFGVKKDGSPSDWDRSPLCSLDPAQLTDKIAAYTGEQFSEFEIQEIDRGSHPIAVMIVRAVHIPLIFTQPGTYNVGGGKQKTAFGRGTLYFRHGAKSEPGTSQDIRQCVQREIESIRKSWLGNIRKVVTAPREYEVRVLPPEIMESDAYSATPIRIVDDSRAPAYRKIDPDVTHPYRQKEVVEAVNNGLGTTRKITAYDIQCVRKIHKIDESKPNFYHASKFASPQYSDSFVRWIVEQYGRDTAFFDKTRAAMRKQ